MVEYIYILTSLNPNTLETTGALSEKESKLIETVTLNSLFDSAKNTSVLKFFSVDNQLLEQDKDYRNYSLVGAGAGTISGSSALTIDPIADVKKYGYENGDVKLLYTFTDDPFSDSKKIVKHFVESISPDRTEIRCLTNMVDDTVYEKYIDQLKRKFTSNSYLPDFFIALENDVEIKVLNVEKENTAKGIALLLKLYQAVPNDISTNSEFTVKEIIAESIAYQVTAELVEQKVKYKNLKGPNFDVELNELAATPTEFFNYNELFSYPVTGSNYELLSLFNKTGAEITVDHSDYSNFIHFSSAEERLRNFKYKLDLINSYESTISSIRESGYTSVNASGSTEYYEGLISGIVRNFDHYDRHLYFSSGSSSWPKSNTSKPYTNYPSTHISASSWYSDQLVIAEAYDNTNSDYLISTIPLFLREDVNNEPYMLFVSMIGQHFDNLWIYFKAVSDKYDGDNRLDFGISKDLVKEAIESFGISIYGNNKSTGNLFSLLIGETPVTGSELITQTLSILSGSSNEHLQPVSVDNYQKEIYKRIYHNIPLLLKAKGTERGLRALINCYGIPSNILEIRQLGGTKIDRERYLSPYAYTTSSLDKIRLDLTGSNVTGSTLSRYTSINNEVDKYSDDIHTVEVGFSFTDIVDDNIKRNITSSFDIDDYIGDPRHRYESSYNKLDRILQSIGDGAPNWEDVQLLWTQADFNWNEYYRGVPSFLRLIKFFDNSLFRTIRDFIPARSNLNVGVIIKPSLLNRSKAKQVEVSWEQKQYTGSIDILQESGSHAGAFVKDSTTNYNDIIVTPLGKAPRNITDEAPKLNGEFSGSDYDVIKSKDLNRGNIFKKTAQPIIKLDLTVFNLSEPIPASCNISLVATYLGEVINLYATGSGAGLIETVYPSSNSSTTSLSVTNNYDVYEFVSAQATATYPNTFDGWYTQASGGSLVTASATLNIYFETQDTIGPDYYARFS